MASVSCVAPDSKNTDCITKHPTKPGKKFGLILNKMVWEFLKQESDIIRFDFEKNYPGCTQNRLEGTRLETVKQVWQKYRWDAGLSEVKQKKMNECKLLESIGIDWWWMEPKWEGGKGICFLGGEKGHHRGWYADSGELVQKKAPTLKGNQV